MDDRERQIETIKAATLKQIPEVEKIYLFGSRAYGAPGKDSDIDIFVVIPNKRWNVIDHETNIRGAIREFIDFDMLIETKDRFEYRRERNRLENTVFSRGRLLYERS
jgi:predicted nucleotidyltransferase